MCVPSPVIPVIEVESVPLSITPLAPSEASFFSCADGAALEGWVTTVLSARLQVVAAHDAAFAGQPQAINDELEIVLSQYRLILQAGTPDCAQDVDQRLRETLWLSLGMLQSYGNEVDADYLTMRGEIEIELQVIIEEVLEILSEYG
jgi:hypothetical protein